jgi:TPP-dependent pyruvate/acetoin dehydrogenase alpha subunit
MARIREFELTAQAAMAAGELPGVIHLSIGQEAVAAGVCANLDRHDFLTSTHRGHGHAIAKGADVRAMMAELYGRAAGTCRGKGGSMHIADFSVGMLGANGVVAGGIPIAVGAAQGLTILGRTGVVACFFGDGAINRGPFLEGLNWARIYNLPVLFVCENNGFAAFTRTAAVTGGPGAAARAESIGIPATSIDGNDVLGVDAAASELVRSIRAGSGPQFLNVTTYRLEGHTSSDPAAYRDADELAAQRLRDPIVLLEANLRDSGVPQAEFERVSSAARREMHDARDAARTAPFPDPATLLDDVQDIGAPAWRR